jgi:Uncharacterized protein conserved in bacteria (DUF2252)
MNDSLPTRTERFTIGKALRARTPREVHAELHGPRTRDAVAILAESDASRVPELLPKRYQRMTESAFGFLRGAAAVMANDLARQPSAGVPVQALRRLSPHELWRIQYAGRQHPVRYQ